METLDDLEDPWNVLGERWQRTGPSPANAWQWECKTFEERWGSIAKSLGKPWCVGNTLGETLAASEYLGEPWGKLGIGRPWISGWPVQALAPHPCMRRNVGILEAPPASEKTTETDACPYGNPGTAGHWVQNNT
eukprot:gene8164-biopygen6307